VTTTSPRRDPGRQAALDDQRDFLLRSLEDLEAEHDAGDLDDDDYTTLKDDYTARAAAVLRSIAQRDASRTVAPAHRRLGRTAIVVVGVAALALLAGVLVKDAAGRRDPGEGITGGGAESSRALIARGDDLLGQGDTAGALEAYGEALAIDPTDVDALLRTATAQVASGDAAAAIATYDEVLGLEPENLEALAFQASLFHQQGDTARAVEQLRQVNEMDMAFVDAWSLLIAVLGDDGRLDEGLDEIEALAAGGDADVALAVAQQLSGILSPVDTLRVYDALLSVDPDNALALTYRAWQPASLVMRGAITGADADAVLTEALTFLDRAVEVDPTLPDARAFRAILLHRLGRDDEAADELRAFDATDPPAEMQAIVDQSGLRDELGVPAP
jgi:tetratricopeptide (TPR) repeat protein